MGCKQRKQVLGILNTDWRKITWPFPKSTATKWEWLVTRQMAEKEDILVYLKKKKRNNKEVLQETVVIQKHGT